MRCFNINLFLFTVLSVWCILWSWKLVFFYLWKKFFWGEISFVNISFPFSVFSPSLLLYIMDFLDYSSNFFFFSLQLFYHFDFFLYFLRDLLLFHFCWFQFPITILNLSMFLFYFSLFFILGYNISSYL